VLQEHEFERVGGTHAIQADVRVIAATNRDLKTAVSKAVFRSDLFYRLNVFPIEMPSLRARSEDIPLLTEYFIQRYAQKLGKKVSGISKKNLAQFRFYSWPGDIRELQNVIERSLILCETESFSMGSDAHAKQQAQSKKNTPMKVLVLYHIIYGHTLQLARAVEEGVKSVAGVEALFRRAPKFPHIEKQLEASDSYESNIWREQKDIQGCSLDDLCEADGMLLGSPTRYGNMTAQMKALVDAPRVSGCRARWKASPLASSPRPLPHTAERRRPASR
jgi:transcriptional regulator with GAF, ATPase, and Fis domain